jgi:hypothetical protein
MRLILLALVAALVCGAANAQPAGPHQGADAPAPISGTAPAQAQVEFVVVSRDTRNDVVLSSDTLLPLIKGGRTEDALLRQAVYVTSTLTVVRNTTAPNVEMLRWTYESFLLHQLCFTSMTGQFSCTVAEATALPEKSSGETPITPSPAGGTGPQTNPAAEAARAAVVDSIRARGTALFGEDRRLKIDPMLRTAGVSVRATSGAGAARR